MSLVENCCLLSRGEFYISEWSSDCLGGLSEITCESQPSAFIKVGNVSSAQVNIAAQVLGRENKFNKLSDVCPRVLIEGISLNITFNCASQKNLHRALFAEELAVDSGTHTKDFCLSSLEAGMLFPFDKVGAIEAGIQVFLRDALGNLEATLVIDVDFAFTKSGIVILQDLPIGDAVTLRMIYDYDTSGYYEMDFGSKIIGYKSLYFKGANYNDDPLTQFDCYFEKVLFTPLNSFDLISRDEFFTLNMQATVEKQGNSWFKIIKQED